MRIQCPSCQRWIRLSPEAAEKFAGQHVKCPGCSGLIEVPMVDPDKPASAAGSPQPAVPRVEPSHQGPVAIAPPATGFPNISVAAPQPRERTPPAKKESGIPWRQWPANRGIQIAAGGGLLAAVGLLLLCAWLFSGGETKINSPVAQKQSAKTKKAAKSAKSGNLSEGHGIVEFQVEEEARRNMAVDVDGAPIFVQPRGALEVKLAPGTHKIVLRRRGFEQLDVQLVIRQGDRTAYEPKWEPIVLPSNPTAVAASANGGSAPGEPVMGAGGPPSFDTWLQDLEAAKREAVETNKDIFVLFDGSDWCPYSVRMANELFFDPRFQSAVAWKYVLVFVDFPRSDDAKAKVQDAARNQGLMELFGVEGFPAVILADKAGLPYGRLGYEPGGVDQFLNQVTAVQAIRDQRDALVEEVRLSLGKDKVVAARRTFQLLASLGFETRYADVFQKWYEESQHWDAANVQGHQEAFFEIVWMTKVESIPEGDRQRLDQTVAELDAWKQKQVFKDANRAGRMHLRAALAMQHDVKAVERYAEAGLTYRPSDAKLKEVLAYLKAAAPTLNVLASGSGFVVGEGGYVLTNRHVTDGEGQLVVRLPERQELVPAEVVAADPAHDLALVRLQVLEGISLQPLALASTAVSRGTRVGAFGYPLGDLVGKGLKLTTGIISSTDDQTKEGMLLLDCRINPGNSGGPLCNARGEVVGIVTAKSYSDRELDSYGLAIPASRISEFLGQHLPGFTPPAAAPADGAPGEWDAVDRIVSPSVLMLQKMRTAK